MKEENARDWFVQGNKLYFKGNLEEAIKCYQKAAELNHEDAIFFAMWGKVLTDLANVKQDEQLFRESFEKFAKAAELSPEKQGAAFAYWGKALADFAGIKRDVSLFKESFEKFDKATELKPDSAEIYIDWGDALLGLVKIKRDEALPKEAIKKYKKAIELKPNDAYTFMMFGNAYIELADIKQDESLLVISHEEFNKAAQLAPNDATIFYNWGVVFLKLAKIRNEEYLFEEAIKKYEKAIRLKPNHTPSYVNWGTALNGLARIRQEEALFNISFEKFRIAIQIEPKDARAFISWGDALCGLANIKKESLLLEEAIKKYEEAMQLKLDEAVKVTTFINWGSALADLAKIKQDEALFRDAFDKYKNAEQLNPDQSLDVFILWIHALVKLSQIKQNELCYKEIFEKCELTLQLLQLKSEQVSQQELEQFLQSKSEQKSKQAWVNFIWGNALVDLAEIKLDDQKLLLKKSFEKYNEAAKLDPDFQDTFIHWGLAISDIKSNESLFREEFRIFEQKSKKTYDPTVWMIKGVLYLTLGEKTEASQCFERTNRSILEIFNLIADDDYIEDIIKEGTLNSLLDSDNYDGQIFKDATKGITDKEILDIYKHIYILSISIINQLHVRNENEQTVAHYCRKDVAQKILFKNSKFRLNAIKYSNDPTEGKELFRYLFGEDRSFMKNLSSKDYGVFAGCFSFNYDSLNQFRLYGKEDGKEGTGISLVFRQDFSSSIAKEALKLENPILNKNIITKKEKSLSTNIFEEGKVKKQPFFRCMYIDPMTQRVITVGQKEKYLFCWENKINPDEQYDKYYEYIYRITKRINDKMEKLKEMVQDKGLKQSVIEKLLINLRYLVKHISFKEEQECRIIKICYFDDKNVKVEEHKHIYIDYEPTASDHLEKIYFGPKTTDTEQFKDILAHNRLRIPCEKSNNPLA
jgi:tetratricopeptide (TPR) repeat protein